MLRQVGLLCLPAQSALEKNLSSIIRMLLLTGDQIKNSQGHGVHIKLHERHEKGGRVDPNLLPRGAFIFDRWL